MIAGIKYINDFTTPVFGRLTTTVGDDVDILAIIISVGVTVGDRFICSVGVNVIVGVDDKTKVGVGVLDGIGVGVLVAVGVRVGRGAAAFC